MGGGDSVNWLYGVGYSILASFIGGGSKLAIRKSYIMLQDTFVQQDDQNLRAQNLNVSLHMNIKSSHVSLLLRLSGMFGMTFLNPLFSVIAMQYASPSILSTFSGLTLVWIVLFSEFFIGEKPNSKQVLAASLVVAGEVIVAIFGDHTNDDDLDIEEVLDSYENPFFQVYFASMMTFILCLFYVVLTKPPADALARFSFGVLGGSITGFQNFLKDSLTIIKVVGEDHHARYPPVLYLMLACAGLSSFVGLLFLTACMKRYDATYSSAMFVGSFVISASIMSAVHYDTFQNLESFVNWVMYPVGLVVLMIGLGVLVNASHHNDGFESIMMEPETQEQGADTNMHSQDFASSSTSSNIISSPLLKETNCVYQQMNDDDEPSSNVRI